MTYIPNRKFDEMLETAREQAGHKVDLVTPIKKVSFDTECQLQIVDGPAPVRLPLTDHALAQVNQRLGRSVFLDDNHALLSKDLLMALPADWRALNLNRAIAEMPEKTGWTVRSFDGSARGVMDKYYFPFDNDKMLEIVGEILREKAPEHRISPQSFVAPDEMRVDVIIGQEQTRPDGGGNAAWQWGVGLRNNEIGKGSGGAYAVIKRGSCDNSVAVDMEGYNYSFRHWAKKDSLRNLRKTELYTAIANILPFGQELIEKMLAADYEQLPNFAELVAGMTIAHDWSDEFVGHVWEGAEAQHTVAGMINGVTWAAQKLPDPAARFEAELLGGSILVEPDNVFAPALFALEKRDREEQRNVAREVRRQARLARQVAQ